MPASTIPARKPSRDQQSRGQSRDRAALPLFAELIFQDWHALG
ncbi:hypothetical protein [Arthrobacter sp. ISL-28]|nr:hypothetical protein [Arthrobacter sp. ISL-28]